LPGLKIAGRNKAGLKVILRMTVYKYKKDCKGCETGSSKEKDHNHFILDSDEYLGVLMLLVIVFITFIIVLGLLKVFGVV